MPALNIVVYGDKGHQRLNGGLSAIDKCAAVLSLGGYLQRGTIVAKGVGDGMWECRRLRAIVPALEEWSETIPFFCPKTGKPISWLAGSQPMAQRDYSAFGAARAFLDTVGEAGALKACDEARARARNARLRESQSASPLLAAIAALCGGCVPSTDWLTDDVTLYVAIGLLVAGSIRWRERTEPWPVSDYLRVSVCAAAWPLFLFMLAVVVLLDIVVFGWGR